MSADVDIQLHLKTSVEDSTHRCFRKGDRYTKNREAGRILDVCGCQTVDQHMVMSHCSCFSLVFRNASLDLPGHWIMVTKTLIFGDA